MCRIQDIWSLDPSRQPRWGGGAVEAVNPINKRGSALGGAVDACAATVLCLGRLLMRALETSAQTVAETRFNTNDQQLIEAS
jgi:hypothetical protein